MSERRIQSEIMLALADHGMTAWRNNVGTGWAGSRVTQIKRTGAVQVEPGDVVVRNARPLHAGLCKGSADLVGLRSVIVTPEMVGEALAQFVALEVKRPGARPTQEQRQFLEFVGNAGGFARVVRGVGDLG